MQGSLEPLGGGRGPAGPGDSQAGAELRELALRWFVETQAPLILQDGALPPWFHGFITRKQAERRLGDQAVGSFLVRLSDRATGYILSYRGRDRCRHFVITQLPHRRYLVSGDTHSHGSLAALLRHHQGAPFEPFGETLAAACPRPQDEDPYDAITLGLHGDPPGQGDAPAGPSPWGGPGQPGSPRPPPRPRSPFLATAEQSLQPPGRVPPVPERRASLPDPPDGGSPDIVYAELRQTAPARLGLGTGRPGPGPAGSQACSPDSGAQRRAWDGGQHRPDARGPPLSARTPAPSPVASQAPWGRLPPAEAPGPSAAPWSQGSPQPSPRAQPCSPDSAAHTYALLLRTAGSLGEEDGGEPGQEGGSAYEQIPACWGGPARPPVPRPVPGPGLTPGRLSGPTDWGHQGTPGPPEARSPCEQSPAAKSKDAGRPHKPDKSRRLFFADKKPRP
ncbi:SH2 domain-containing protein 7 [Eptesicus fuscus]|uniref:SH2 domain-containing protein 7 n=1 Tax=Eptesicus fuscus TaxID=29078 RepID=UPI002404140C|nr:SH2 domain-containing protein 7 [Eptesicus fuscus]